VNPNNKFEVYVDQSLVHSGSLLEDMTSVAVVAVTIELLCVSFIAVHVFFAVAVTLVSCTSTLF